VYLSAIERTRDDHPDDASDHEGRIAAVAVNHPTVVFLTALSTVRDIMPVGTLFRGAIRMTQHDLDCFLSRGSGQGAHGTPRE
jgi:hypothetical protein